MRYIIGIVIGLIYFAGVFLPVSLLPKKVVGLENSDTKEYIISDFIICLIAVLFFFYWMPSIDSHYLETAVKTAIIAQVFTVISIGIGQNFFSTWIKDFFPNLLRIFIAIILLFSANICFYLLGNPITLMSKNILFNKVGDIISWL